MSETLQGKERNYFEALKNIHSVLMFEKKLNINEIISVYGVDQNIFKVLTDQKILSYVQEGNQLFWKWEVREPSIKMAKDIFDKSYKLRESEPHNERQNMSFPLIGYEIKILWFNIKVVNIYLNTIANKAIRNEWK